MRLDDLKICIDPGHGASNRNDGVYDSGAQAFGREEADFALEWGLTGRWVLRQSGIAVYMTRDDDTDKAPVGLRDNMARANNCDLFVSLHCNSGGGKARGQEVFYRDTADKQLASVVLNCLLLAFGDEAKNRGLKTENMSQHKRLAVLDFDGPACLAEIGFIDNFVDINKMSQRATRLAFWEEFVDQLKEVDL